MERPISNQYLPLIPTKNGCYPAALAYSLHRLGYGVDPAELDVVIGRQPGQGTYVQGWHNAAKWLVEQGIVVTDYRAGTCSGRA